MKHSQVYKARISDLRDDMILAIVVALRESALTPDSDGWYVLPQPIRTEVYDDCDVITQLKLDETIAPVNIHVHTEYTDNHNESAGSSSIHEFEIELLLEILEELERAHRNESTVAALALKFSDALIDEIGMLKMQVVISRNRTEKDSNICHTHDFCDANMVMHDAVCRLLKKKDVPIPYDPATESFVMDAWDWAKQVEFFIGHKFTKKGETK